MKTPSLLASVALLAVSPIFAREAPKSALDHLGYRHYGRLAGYRAEESDAGS